MPTRPRKIYRLTRDVVFPKGNNIVFVSRMRHDIYRSAMAIVSIDPEFQYECYMNWDAAMKLGLIEEVSD